MSSSALTVNPHLNSKYVSSRQKIVARSQNAGFNR